ncbi:melanocortin receptor 5-like [Stylophora pistillata]|uniref:melanocortin receptor 5-like n=1 Tax=Stylophora pistillata TaxID=50429 RepID=UPI000C0558F8|nr:melanocortin receptor 5-like [Stylophora pistillata]XP_022806912.1 melanocortin receptor 5-like [Stylophora pistillata]
MSTTNFTRGGTQTEAFQRLICSSSGSLVSESHLELVSFATVNILLSITAFLGNSLILVALHKESSLHRPSKLLYRSLATTDLLVGLIIQPLIVTFVISLVQEHWVICQYANTAAYISSIALCGVSLLTIAAISVDRLLALLLRLRYRQIVTFKRTCIIVASFWVFSLVAACLYTIFDHRILYLSTGIIIPLCLIISMASHIKIFCTLRYHQTKVHDHVQQHLSQPNALNMARYKKAVYSALWVQLAFIVCYTPYFIVETVIGLSKTFSSQLIILRRVTILSVYVNSTLNPFLYLWKISEVRQAVKQTIRQALCCPWS